MNPGQIISHYEIVSYLGGGGMGEVWLAADRRINRQVAIKGLHPQLLKNEDVRSRFRNEAMTLAKLQHPNIVGLFDYLELDNGSYLILEYVQGEPLDDYIRLRTGPIPEPKAIDLFSQVLAGVAYAHQRGIIHRDIKPSNFLVDQQRQVKILDFGIAKVLEEDKKLTKTGTRMGTVYYMSPEQVRGEPADIRSDIYALGVTYFQMLTGTKPYSEEATEFQVYNDIVSKPLPRANTRYPAVSPHAQSVIDRATEKDPAHRFQSCAEFLSALTNPDYKYSSGYQNPPPIPVQAPAYEPVGIDDEEVELILKRKKRRRTIRALIWTFIAAALLTTGLIGYSEGWFDLPGQSAEIRLEENPSPLRVAEVFLRAVENQDSLTAYDLAATGCKSELRSLFQLWGADNTTTYTVREETIYEDDATVYYDKHSPWGDEKQSLSLAKNGRSWKVNCSKAELF